MRINGLIEVDRSKRNAQNHRKASAKDQELKYFENIREPETVNRNDVSKSKVYRELRALTQGALKSVEEIKTFVDKLAVKVFFKSSIANYSNLKNLRVN